MNTRIILARPGRTGYTWRSLLWGMLLAVGVQMGGRAQQVPPPRKATDAEALAGTAVRAFVTPDQVAAVITGRTGATNGMTQLEHQASLASGTNNYTGTNATLTGTVSARTFALDQWKILTNGATHTFILTNTTTGATLALGTNGGLTIKGAFSADNGTLFSDGAGTLTLAGMTLSSGSHGVANIAFGGILGTISDNPGVLYDDGSGNFVYTLAPSLFGDNITAIPGASLNDGSVSSNKLDALTKAQLALAGSGTVPSGLVTNLAPANIVVTNAGVNTTITSNSVTTATLNATTGNMNTANVTNANFPTLTPAAGHTNGLTVLPTGALSTNDIANLGSGAAQTPWTGPIDAASNGVARVGYIGFTNNAAANTSSLLQSNYNSSSYGSTLALTGKTNGVASQSAYSADNGVFGTVYAGGGNVSIIPTNGAGVNALSNTLTTLPLGITNNTGQRVQPVVQVRWFNDGAGAMILTASNETTGMKLIFGEPASASLGFSYTNWFNLPITSTNDVWRMRNESQNTSSANVMNQWFIGL